MIMSKWEKQEGVLSYQLRVGDLLVEVSKNGRGYHYVIAPDNRGQADSVFLDTNTGDITIEGCQDTLREHASQIERLPDTNAVRKIRVGLDQILEKLDEDTRKR